METRTVQQLFQHPEVGYGDLNPESLFNFEGPKLSLEARPAVEKRREMSLSGRDSRKIAPAGKESLRCGVEKDRQLNEARVGRRGERLDSNL